MNEIGDRLENVRADLASAARRANRSSEEIKMVAVSKGHDTEKVRQVMQNGHFLFGESKVQEARAKIPLLPSQLRWHFIGHLQKNKIRHALPLFELLHSVHSVDLAQQVDRIAKQGGFYPRVLLEINVGAEGSKFGFKPEDLRKAMDELLALERISIEGVMAIPPLTEKAEASRPYFAQLRQLRDRLEMDFNLKLPELSMGMSNDFVIAIEEGATLVRIGTAIFGARVPSKSDFR